MHLGYSAATPLNGTQGLLWRVAMSLRARCCFFPTHAASTAGRDCVGHLRLRAQMFCGQIAPRYTYTNFSTQILAHPHYDHPRIPYSYLYAVYGTQVPSRSGRPASSAATIPRRPIGTSHMAKRLEAKCTLDACSRRCSSIRAPPPPGRTDGRLVDLSNDSLGAVAVVGHAHH